eukprot:1216057-Amphidinium_carterae.2
MSTLQAVDMNDIDSEKLRPLYFSKIRKTLQVGCGRYEGDAFHSAWSSDPSSMRLKSLVCIRICQVTRIVVGAFVKLWWRAKSGRDQVVLSHQV